MKKVIVTLIFAVSIFAEAHAQFNFIGQNGSNVSVNGDNYQVGGMINGNRVQVSNTGFSISGSGGSLSVGNTNNLYGANPGGIYGLIIMASRIISMLVPVTIALGVLTFFWFLVTYIWLAVDKPDEQRKSLKGMGYSILAIFVMVSLWGIIYFIGSILGIGQGGAIADFKLPGVK